MCHVILVTLGFGEEQLASKKRGIVPLQLGFLGYVIGSSCEFVRGCIFGRIFPKDTEAISSNIH